MADHPILRARWDGLWAHIAETRGVCAPAPDPSPPPFELIAAAYSASGRHYHNLDHLAHCFSELDRAVAASAAEDPVAVELALWFHDFVYDPARADNEQESARAAAGAMLEYGGPASATDVVPRLIIYTRHDRPPKTPDGLLMVDIDLSILGQPPAVFDAYDAAIRREYAYLDDTAFAAGRAKVLRGFLARPSVFWTAMFRNRYERAARENLDRAAKRWEDRR